MSLDLVFMHIGILQFIGIGTKRGSFSITNLLTFDFTLFLACRSRSKLPRQDQCQRERFQHHQQGRGLQGASRLRQDSQIK